MEWLPGRGGSTFRAIGIDFTRPVDSSKAAGNVLLTARSGQHRHIATAAVAVRRLPRAICDAEGRLIDRNSEQAKTVRRDKAAERMRSARRLEHLEVEVQKLKLLLEIQKKLSDFMGISLNEQASCSCRLDGASRSACALRAHPMNCRRDAVANHGVIVISGTEGGNRDVRVGGGLRASEFGHLGGGDAFAKPPSESTKR
jgi:hypothetical protein